jgi:transcriptional regulator with XRE-family HTH domain
MATENGVDRLGERVATWRRRRGGMTQKVLADLSGLSQPYISQIESGARPLDRKSTQVAIASALNISVAQLLGMPGDPTDPIRSRAVAHVPVIRAALVELSAGERRTPGREPDLLRAAVREATELRNAADYAAVAPLLPNLILDLAGHGSDLAPELVETLFATRYALKTMGYSDLARMAAEQGVRVATEYGDPAWIGQATYSWVQAFPPESAHLGTRVTTRAAAALQGLPDRGAQEVYGCLHILAAFYAAIANRADDATGHLAEAQDIARSLGEPSPYGSLSAGFNANWFGPTQVEYWRVAVAAELGDAGSALVVSERIDLSVVPVPNRWVYYWTDMARALAAGGKDREAMHALARAERAAPQHFRFNPVVRDLMSTILLRAKRRAVEGEMTALAHKLGIEPV